MYFAKNEIIELEDGLKYLVLDTAFIDEKAYYKLKKLENNMPVGESRYITANNDEGKLYLNERLTKSERDKLIELLGE